MCKKFSPDLTNVKEYLIYFKDNSPSQYQPTLFPENEFNMNLMEANAAIKLISSLSIQEKQENSTFYITYLCYLFYALPDSSHSTKEVVSNAIKTMFENLSPQEISQKLLLIIIPFLFKNISQDLPIIQLIIKTLSKYFTNDNFFEQYLIILVKTKNSKYFPFALSYVSNNSLSPRVIKNAIYICERYSSKEKSPLYLNWSELLGKIQGKSQQENLVPYLHDVASTPNPRAINSYRTSLKTTILNSPPMNTMETPGKLALSMKTKISELRLSNSNKEQILLELVDMITRIPESQNKSRPDPRFTVIDKNGMLIMTISLSPSYSNISSQVFIMISKLNQMIISDKMLNWYISLSKIESSQISKELLERCYQHFRIYAANSPSVHELPQSLTNPDDRSSLIKADLELSFSYITRWETAYDGARQVWRLLKNDPDLDILEFFDSLNFSQKSFLFDALSSFINEEHTSDFQHLLDQISDSSKWESRTSKVSRSANFLFSRLEEIVSNTPKSERVTKSEKRNTETPTRFNF